MKHSLINSNNIQLNGLEFFEKPICDDEQYIEMDDELNTPMQSKGNKCIFLSYMPTRAESYTCQYFYITNNNEWNQDSVTISDLREISQLSTIDTRYIYQTKLDTMYTYLV